MSTVQNTIEITGFATAGCIAKVMEVLVHA